MHPELITKDSGLSPVNKEWKISEQGGDRHGREDPEVRAQSEDVFRVVCRCTEPTGKERKIKPEG